MHCPLADLELYTDKCPLDTCCYCLRGKCVEPVVREVRELPVEHRMESISIVFQVSVKQVQAAVKNIAVAENARRFFIYITGKQTIRELQPEDVEVLRNSQDRYAAWSQFQGTSKPKFSSVLQVFQSILLDLYGDSNADLSHAK